MRGTDGLKDQARIDAYARRKAAKTPKANAQANAHLLNFLGDQGGRVIAGYMVIRTEIDPVPAMTALEKSSVICVPVVLGAGRALEFRQWTPDTVMKVGAFGALIPMDAPVCVPEVVILPLAAFDDRGFRLGYGGGFYDRTLEVLRADASILAVGFAFSGQQAAMVPTEPTDQRMDALVTENGVVVF